MKMINLTINNQQVSVTDGSKVLDAAKMVGITIPTLCHSNGYKPNTSCMICVVHELKTDSLILACSMPVEDGMRIVTDSERVREARKDTLDLLLSEHVGDCEAPCQRTCPANMNIPLMIRQIKENNLEEAIITVKTDIPLPAVLSRICPAPCERGCHRKYYDNPVSICQLIRFVADVDLAKESPCQPDIRAKSGKKVAVIGAGPTGLSAAYYMSQSVHDCVIYEKNGSAGGNLCLIPETELPENVISIEIEIIKKLGVEFLFNNEINADSFNEMKMKYDAIILATGNTEDFNVSDIGFEKNKNGIKIDKSSLQTDQTGIFACGSVIKHGKMAIRSAAQGKAAAISTDLYLKTRDPRILPKRFDSKFGKLNSNEAVEYLKESIPGERIDPKAGYLSGYIPEEAINEAKRCMHCDCRKADNCKLRNYSDEYNADRKKYLSGQRKTLKKDFNHEKIVYEREKCIKCNLCVEITLKNNELIGLARVSRGFDVYIDIPMGKDLSEALQKTAEQCAHSCPTGALAIKN